MLQRCSCGWNHSWEFEGDSLKNLPNRGHILLMATRNPAVAPVEVGIPQVVVWDFWTINNSKPCRKSPEMLCFSFVWWFSCSIEMDETYCWWTKFWTTKDDDYRIIYRVLTIPGGAGFCPSTVRECCSSNWFSTLSFQGFLPQISEFQHPVGKCNSWICDSSMLGKGSIHFLPD